MKIKKIIKEIIYTANKNPLSVAFYNREIAKRAKMPLEDLLSLSKPINMFSPFTNEIHQGNDWYGHAKNFKNYLNISKNYQFKFTIEHGVFLTEQVSDLEVESDLPSFVTYSNYRVNVLKKYKKNVFCIGPFLHYAPHFYSKEKINSEKKRLGTNILLFHGHSIDNFIPHYDTDWFLQKVQKIKKNFKTVRVCIYWIDVLRGVHKYYQNLGIECVTAGHILDPLFHPRLKSIIEISDLTISNDASTHVGYCVYLNKPHIIFHDNPEFTADKENTALALDFKASKPYQEVLKEFSQVRFSISKKQHQLVHQYFGSKEDIKTKEEFQKIVDLTEKIYQKN